LAMIPSFNQKMLYIKKQAKAFGLQLVRTQSA